MDHGDHQKRNFLITSVGKQNKKQKLQRKKLTHGIRVCLKSTSETVAPYREKYPEKIKKYLTKYKKKLKNLPRWSVSRHG
jgi:hypothetical protein